VANFASGDVSAYAVDAATGALTAVPGTPFPAGAGARGVGVDPAERFVYVANHLGGSISAYTINANNGVLTPIDADGDGTNGIQGFAAGDRPGGVTIDPSGKFLYAANLVSNDVSAYAINAATGALTASPAIAGRAGNLELAMTRGAAPVKYTPRFAYVANQNSDDVSAYSIDPGTGALTAVAGSPFAAGNSPFAVAVSPSGKFAYAANHNTNNVSAYTINAGTGALTLIQNFAAGVGPRFVTADPSGRFAYVANDQSHNVSAYAIDASTGVLTEISGSPFATGGTAPQSVTVDPSGRFAYAANSGSDDVSAYAVDAGTGALTRIDADPGTPGIQNFPAGILPFNVTVDPSGKFVYVANAGADNVSAYTINASTGALAEVAGSPFGAGSFPRSVTVDPRAGSRMWRAPARAASSPMRSTRTAGRSRRFPARPSRREWNRIPSLSTPRPGSPTWPTSI